MICIPTLLLMDEKIVIIGNGIAGSTLALQLAEKGTASVTLISDESSYFFSRTALMYVYMGHLTKEQLEPFSRESWDQSPIQRVKAQVLSISPEDKELSFRTSEEDVKQLSYDRLVIATGSKPAFYDWKGQEAEGVLGLYHLSDLDKLEKWAPNASACPEAVVVGGGLIGIELCEMLLSRQIKTTLIIRENFFWSSHLPESDAQFVEKHLHLHRLNLIKEDELQEINEDENGHVSSVQTKKGETISCRLVGITTGVRPNIEFLRDSGLDIDKGLLVDEHLKTSDPSIYAIGDCAQLRNPLPNRLAIEPVWYTGKLMGETLAQTFSGEPIKYNPGVWYNSAKFFDLEYQTYGKVSPKALKPKSEQHFHWETDDKAVTLAYNETSGVFLGINTFGIRLNHKIISSWIEDQIEVEKVVFRLEEAHFDPEFSNRYYKQIKHAFVQNH
jgi:NAD(P)H-nitrite reductase large subunit